MGAAADTAAHAQHIASVMNAVSAMSSVSTMARTPKSGLTARQTTASSAVALP